MQTIDFLKASVVKCVKYFQNLSTAGNILTEHEVTSATKRFTALISSSKLNGYQVFGQFHNPKQVHLILKIVWFLRFEYSSVLQYYACGMGFIYFFFGLP